MKTVSPRRRLAFRSCALTCVWVTLAAPTPRAVYAQPQAPRAPDYPLALHTRWTYQLRQEVGPGVRFGEQDARLAKGNVLETTAAAEVTGSDVVRGERYVRLEIRRAGRLWQTEWYRAADGALLLGKTFNKETGEEVEMVPEQKVLSATLAAGESWTWRANGAAVVIRFKVVGPAKVTVPAGSFESTHVSHELTIETPVGLVTARQNRWFVPGVGYVKQQTETRAGDRLLSSAVLTLVKFETQ